MACAMAMGNWTTGTVRTGTVETNTVKTEQIKEFLGMKSKYADDDKSGFYPNPKVTDSGVTENSNLASFASSVIAATNAAAAIKIANKQYDIARAYYELAQQKWDRFRNQYMPCERKEINEAHNTPLYQPQYDNTRMTWENEVDRNFALAQSRIDQLNALYCICPDTSLTQDIALMQSMAIGDTGNFAYRYEEHRKIAKDDVRWTRRQQALNRGRDLQSDAVRYADAAANAYGDVGNKVGQAAQGAISALGYFMNRNETIYPQRPPRQTRPTSPFLGNGFIGAQPENGEYGFVTNYPLINHSPVDGYNNTFTTYTTNYAITSEIGAQQPTSSGG